MDRAGQSFFYTGIVETGEFQENLTELRPGVFFKYVYESREVICCIIADIFIIRIVCGRSEELSYPIVDLLGFLKSSYERTYVLKSSPTYNLY